MLFYGPAWSGRTDWRHDDSREYEESRTRIHFQKLDSISLYQKLYRRVHLVTADWTTKRDRSRLTFTVPRAKRCEVNIGFFLSRKLKFLLLFVVFENPITNNTFRFRFCTIFWILFVENNFCWKIKKKSSY